MTIEITSKQYDSIQDEVIRLEEYLSDNFDTIGTWEAGATRDKIAKLKGILEKEEIEIE